MGTRKRLSIYTTRFLAEWADRQFPRGISKKISDAVEWYDAQAGLVPKLSIQEAEFLRASKGVMNIDCEMPLRDRLQKAAGVRPYIGVDQFVDALLEEDYQTVCLTLNWFGILTPRSGEK